MKYVNTLLWEAHGFRLLRVSEDGDSGQERTLWAYELESSAEQLAPAQLTSVAWGVLRSLVEDGFRYWGAEPTRECCRACGGSGIEGATPAEGQLVDDTSPEAIRTKALIAAVLQLLDVLRSVASVAAGSYELDPEGCWCPSVHLFNVTDDPWTHSDRCRRVRSVIAEIDPQAGRVA